MGTPGRAPAADKALGPLKVPVFRLLWVATILGNVGTFVRDVASAWLATDLGGGAVAVAAVQAAATLPICLLAIPAGVLSDTLDRRRLLMAVQLFLALVTLALLGLAWRRDLGLTSLVALSFLGGAGAALMAPAWQAIVPELVGRPLLREAVALNSLALNVSRSIGPALGGLLVAVAGAVAAYGVHVLSSLAVLVALQRWRRAAPEQPLGSEPFGSALAAGLRFALASPGLRRLLGLAGLYFGLASAIWTLLPLLVRERWHGGAGLYGLLLGAVGVGAVCCALLMPRLRARLGANGLLLAAMALTGATVVGLSVAPTAALAAPLLWLLGWGWIAVLTTLSSGTQAELPDWVRGRGLALYLTVFNGALALGSLAWGAAAHGHSPASVLAWSGAALLLATGGLWRLGPLPASDADLAPAAPWPEPAVADPTAIPAGPVLVQVEYRVQPAERAAFLQALAALGRSRRQSGAFRWGVAEDSAAPGTVLEWFLVPSWDEHRRQHHRRTQEDARLQSQVHRFHQGEEPPRVRHYLNLMD